MIKISAQTLAEAVKNMRADYFDSHDVIDYIFNNHTNEYLVAAASLVKAGAGDVLAFFHSEIAKDIEQYAKKVPVVENGQIKPGEFVKVHTKNFRDNETENQLWQKP